VLVLQRFEPSPLQTHPVVPDPQVVQQGGVLPPAHPVVAGGVGAAVVLDAPPFGPVVPVGVAVVPLDLGRRGRHPQLEAGQPERVLVIADRAHPPNRALRARFQVRTPMPSVMAPTMIRCSHWFSRSTATNSRR